MASFDAIFNELLKDLYAANSELYAATVGKFFQSEPSEPPAPPSPAVGAKRAREQHTQEREDDSDSDDANSSDESDDDNANLPSKREKDSAGRIPIRTICGDLRYCNSRLEAASFQMGGGLYLLPRLMKEQTIRLLFPNGVMNSAGVIAQLKRINAAGVSGLFSAITASPTSGESSQVAAIQSTYHLVEETRALTSPELTQELLSGSFEIHDWSTGSIMDLSVCPGDDVSASLTVGFAPGMRNSWLVKSPRGRASLRTALLNLQRILVVLFDSAFDGVFDDLVKQLLGNSLKDFADLYLLYVMQLMMASFFYLIKDGAAQGGVNKGRHSPMSPAQSAKLLRRLSTSGQELWERFPHSTFISEELPKIDAATKESRSKRVATKTAAQAALATPPKQQVQPVIATVDVVTDDTGKKKKKPKSNNRNGSGRAETCCAGHILFKTGFSGGTKGVLFTPCAHSGTGHPPHIDLKSLKLEDAIFALKTLKNDVTRKAAIAWITSKKDEFLA
jgi:hypothetical protein